MVDFVAPSLEEDDKLDGSEVYVVSSEWFFCRDLCVRRWEVVLFMLLVKDLKMYVLSRWQNGQREIESNYRSRDSVKSFSLR